MLSFSGSCYGTLWDKFTLTNFGSENNNAEVGYVHYPFNVVQDYDYANQEEIYTYWESWLNYPYINKRKY